MGSMDSPLVGERVCSNVCDCALDVFETVGVLGACAHMCEFTHACALCVVGHLQTWGVAAVAETASYHLPQQMSGMWQNPLGPAGPLLSSFG